MRDAQPLASPCDSSAFGSQAGVLIDEDWQALVSCFEHTGLINRSSWYLLINASAVIWKAAWRAKLAFGCCQSNVWYVGGLPKASRRSGWLHGLVWVVTRSAKGFQKVRLAAWVGVGCNQICPRLPEGQAGCMGWCGL